MRLQEKVELVGVNSDSDASEFAVVDHEIDLENRIIDRFNENIPPTFDAEKVEKFDRLKKKVEREDRH